MFPSRLTCSSNMWQVLAQRRESDCGAFFMHLLPPYAHLPVYPAQLQHRSHPQTCSPAWDLLGLFMVPLLVLAFTPVSYGVEHVCTLRRFMFGLPEWRLAPKELPVLSAGRQNYCSALLVWEERITVERLHSVMERMWGLDPDWIWVRALPLPMWLWDKLFTFHESHFTHL